MARERSILAKLNNANYSPKRIHGAPDDVKEYKLGILVGQAVGTFNTTNPATGEIYEGIRGMFEFTDFDETRPILASGKMFLPTGVAEMVFEALKSDEDHVGIRFAFEVSVFRADNPIGYSWKLTPLMDVTTDDPLAELRKLADTRLGTTKQIAAPEKEKSEAQKEADEKVKAGGKK